MPTHSVSSESIRELMETSGPCLTLVCSTGPELTTALNALRRTIRKQSDETQRLLDSVAADTADLSAASKAGQVAIFRSPSLSVVSHVGSEVTPVAKIGDHFDIRTLLAVAGAQRSFYILAVSQNRARLLACTQDHSEEAPLPDGISTSLEEDRQTRKPDHVLNNMNTAGPSQGSMKGVMSGSSTDREDKDQYMLHFLKELDRGVNVVLKGSSAPLIVAGVEREVAQYSRVNTYRGFVEQSIHGAPDGLEGGEMHKRALEILKDHRYDPAVSLLSDFDKKVGTGHASSHVQEIVAAAYEGRVSHLYFHSAAEYAGTYDSVRQRVRHANSEHDESEDLIESAAIQTLRHGGEVRILAPAELPNGVPVCAIMRYAAPQTAGAGTEAA